ncbi:DUF502 domain-containing protein [Sessilibacter corallicola]|uniref:DUF502 domain-containing protein n=1 Tax=Sessilibacter corallicola TaxID=2904075 RepID=A0ABQ0A633_9GAMM|nr:DUF502 domain-containing protein [Sessilibacter corallicola]MCE2027890.1 DUF502 domain-containing protein [Sessilibacter corallicola]
MQKLLTFVVQGLLTILPLGITLYAIYWLVINIENLSRKTLTNTLSIDWYFPGLGLMVASVFVIVVGLAMNMYGARYLVGIGDRFIQRIPLVKSIYAAISDIITVFNIGKNSDLSAVVSVDMGNGFHQIGFVTGEDTGKRLYPEDNKIGVYLPMSYQIGGFTMYMDRDRITPLDISIEEAMRITLTGGAQSKSSD